MTAGPQYLLFIGLVVGCGSCSSVISQVGHDVKANGLGERHLWHCMSVTDRGLGDEK